MWDSLRDIAAREGITVHELITGIRDQNLASSLTSAIRVYVVQYYRARYLAEDDNFGNLGNLAKNNEDLVRAK